MSTVRRVPESGTLDDGPTAWAVVQAAGGRRLLVDAAGRLRAADGFSHARSMAFLVSLLTVQGIIALVGLASAIGRRGFGELTGRLVLATAPGAAGRALMDAVDQARANGRSGGFVALGLGVVGCLITGTTAMGQVERGLNRIYGIEQDRPTVRKYSHAALLAVTAGTVVALAFISMIYAGAIGDAMGDHPFTAVWGVLRAPLGLALVSVGIAAMFRWCPDRRQPGWGWLWFGAAIAVILWTAATLAFTAVLRSVPVFGDTYGPLAGVVALLLWAALSSIAFFYGAAVAAQLEAINGDSRAIQPGRTRTAPTAGRTEPSGRTSGPPAEGGVLTGNGGRS